MKILNKNGLPCSIRVLFAPGVVILPIELDLNRNSKKSLKSSSIGKITTPGANNTCMEQGKPFLLRIFTFNYLQGYLVENPI